MRGHVWYPRDFPRPGDVRGVDDNGAAAVDLEGSMIRGAEKCDCRMVAPLGTPAVGPPVDLCLPLAYPRRCSRTRRRIRAPARMPDQDKEEREMTVRITTLIENTAGWVNVLGEWGLSMLVETDDCTILSDTGTSEATAHNARSLGVSLEGVEAVVISHGHFDHAGGLLDLLPLIRKPVDVMGHPDIWARKYAYHPGHKVCEYNTGVDYEYIGIPYAREQAEKWGARFVIGAEPVWLTDTVVTSGEVPMRTGYETIDPMLMVLDDGEYKPDPLADDQSIFIKTEHGLVAVLGCAHRGIINHLLRGIELTGVDRVHAVIGGTHLGPASVDRIQKTIKELRRMEVKIVAASHCTGLRAACVLQHEFGDSFLFNNAGTRITL